MRRSLHARYSKGGDSFLPVYPTIIGRESVDERGPWTSALGADAAIFRIDRRIGIGKEIVVVSNFYVDVAKFSFFKDHTVDQLHSENFKLLVQNETGRKVRRLNHNISFSKAKTEIAGLIGVETGAQLLNIKLTAWDQSNNALYYQIFHIPPNDLDLAIDCLV